MSRVVWGAASLLAFALLLLMLALMLRAGRWLRERRRRKFLAVWQPILLNSVEAASTDVPHLARRDLTDFLLVWNHLHESLLGEPKDRLNQIAHALGIGRAASRMLRRGNLRERLLAVITLGHLRERAAWDELAQLALKGGAPLSAAAARALIMIDAGRAVPRLLSLLSGRADWPMARVANMLQAAGADVISEEVARAAIASSLDVSVEGPDEGAGARSANASAHLIRYLELAHNTSASPAARAIAASARDPEVLAASLRLLHSAADLEVVRVCLAHEDWRVRVQAASALGRIGEAEDEGRLIPLLSDTEWWVRYRAAQSLSRLPSMGVPKLKALQPVLADPFARDMLAQVLAEVELR